MLFKSKKNPTKLFIFANVAEKLDNNERLLVTPQKEYNTKEFNQWHTYIRKELKKLSYNHDRRNRKSSKQKAQ